MKRGIHSGEQRDELVGNADLRSDTIVQLDTWTIVRWALWLLVGFFGVFPGIVAYMVWLERKVAARFQDRIGPNRVGPLGLLQPIADALKLLTKEDIVPRFGRSCASGRPRAGHHVVVPGHGGDPVRHRHGTGGPSLGHGLPGRRVEL